MDSSQEVMVMALVLFAGLVGMIELGRRVGVRRNKRDAEGARAGLGAVEGALFGLLGLLVAFTFSGAATRFDARRELIVQEANDIGTAYLRLDLLPAAAQSELRTLFHQYVDLRLEFYRRISNDGNAAEAWDQTLALQNELWSKAVSACQASGSAPATNLVLPALNSMFDITSVRRAAMLTHPPIVVFGMLVLLALVGALFAGYGMAGGKTRSWLHVVGFAAIMTTTIYVILDLEYPRKGFIRVDASDAPLIELQKTLR